MNDQDKPTLARRLSSGFQDLLTVAGIALVGYGCYLVWPPLAPLSVGALFLFFAMWPAVYRLMLTRRSGED